MFKKVNLVREEERSLQMGAVRTPVKSSVVRRSSLDEEEGISWPYSREGSEPVKNFRVPKMRNSVRRPWVTRGHKPSPLRSPQLYTNKLVREMRFERGASVSMPSTPYRRRSCREEQDKAEDE